MRRAMCGQRHEPRPAARKGEFPLGGTEPGHGPSLRTGRAWRRLDPSVDQAARSAKGAPMSGDPLPRPAPHADGLREPASNGELFVAFTWLALQGFGGVLAVA